MGLIRTKATAGLEAFSILSPIIPGISAALMPRFCSVPCHVVCAGLTVLRIRYAGYATWGPGRFSVWSSR